MRLQLDSALTGTGITGTGESAPDGFPAGGSGSGSRSIGGASAGGDSIQISGASSALNRLSADRAARVQQLTAQVQKGSYNVSSSKVSQAIVGNASSPARGKIMGGLFSSLQTASSALDAFSQALGVDQSNIANVSTPGYASQRANILPIDAFRQQDGSRRRLTSP